MVLIIAGKCIDDEGKALIDDCQMALNSLIPSIVGKWEVAYANDMQQSVSPTDDLYLFGEVAGNYFLAFVRDRSPVVVEDRSQQRQVYLV